MKNKKLYYVYIYFDPTKIEKEYIIENKLYNMKPIYVGKGCGNRFKKHLYSLYKSKEKFFKNKLRKMILEDKIEPIILKIKEDLIESEAYNLEIKLIKEIGRRDLNLGPLYNLTDGGGIPNGYIFTEEHRKKLSIANKGKKRSEETKRKISNSHSGDKSILYNKPSLFSGKKHSEKSKQKISEGNKIKYLEGRIAPFKDKHLSDETKNKLSLSRKGKSILDETKKKISDSHKGKKHTEKTKIKISNSLINIPRKLEDKIKISKSKQKYSNEERENVRRMASEGILKYKISEITGISKRTISKIINYTDLKYKDVL